MYEDGKGIEQNNFKAVEFYTKACEGQNGGGCNNLSLMYMHAKGVEQDTQKAIDFSAKSCEYGEEQGCQNHAHYKEHFEL